MSFEPAPSRFHRLCAFFQKPTGSTLLLLVFSLGGTMLIGCNSKSKPANIESTNQPTNRVVAVSYPLQYLTHRIVGDVGITVDFPASDSDTEHSWRPSREQILDMQSADLIVANGTGATYAKWLNIVSVPDAKLCKTASRGLSLKDFVQIEEVVHAHGPEGEHSHASMVAETWLDPAIAKKQAKYITTSLIKTYPEHEKSFTANLDSLNEDLDQASARLSNLKAKFKLQQKPNIISSSPSLKFLTRAAGIDDQHLSWQHTPTEEEASKDLERLLATFKEDKPSAILYANGLPPEELSVLLNNLGLTTINLSTIERAPTDGDYLSELAKNIDALEALIAPKN